MPVYHSHGMNNLRYDYDKIRNTICALLLWLEIQYLVFGYWKYYVVGSTFQEGLLSIVLSNIVTIFFVTFFLVVAFLFLFFGGRIEIQ